jgi:ribosomal protein S18 acetylase RimI-like enzyme
MIQKIVTTIVKGTIQDAEKLQGLAQTTFIESHGHSASTEDILNYVELHLTINKLRMELEDPNNRFYLLFSSDKLIGYSKIIFNSSYKEQTPQTSAKLERLYLLQDYHGQRLGHKLMEFNIQLAKYNHQTGIWLYVWTENKKAIRFYKKYGFEQIAETYFTISRQHKNPNYILYSAFRQ